MAEFEQGPWDVDVTSQTVLWIGPTWSNVLVKNLGPEIAYIGRVQMSNPSSVVDTDIGFPLSVGESIVVPSVDPSTNSNAVGANTRHGTSRLSGMGVN